MMACNPSSPPGEAEKTADQQAEQGSDKEAKPPAASADEGEDIPAPKDVGAPPDDAKKTESGLATKVLKPGKGDKKPTVHDKVSVHYTGWTTDGKMFDSSRKRGRPASFGVKGVIPGWTEALQLMTVGEERRLWIPEELAYKGRPGSPQGMLVFDVELLEVIEGEPPAPPPDDVAAPPDDAKKTKSGLSYKFLEKGDGKDKPKAWDRVTVHYTGWTTDGEMFDSSKRRKRPQTFEISKMALPGWAEGMQLMSVGDKARLWIPEELAFQGRPGPPKGMLVIDVELLSVEHLPEPPPAPKDVAAPPKNAKKTDGGVAYRVIKKGKGKEHPEPTSRVEVHYTGWTTDGKMFDSSVVRGSPATFGLNQVIKGWTEGIPTMVEGEKTLFWVPEELAYKGQPGRPQGMLVFEVELLRILP